MRSRAALVWAATAGLIGLYLVVAGLSWFQRVIDPGEYLYGESIVLDESHRLGLGQPLYPQPSELPLTVTAYPPVYYILVGWLQQLSGNTSYSPGRLVSVAAVVLSAALIAWSVYLIDRSACVLRSEAPELTVHWSRYRWLAGLLAAGLFVTQNLAVLLWGPAHRVDTLALCFALWGLALATSGRTTLAAIPLALSVLTKQSYLAAPLCVLLTLWPNRRSTLTFAAVFAGCLGLVVGVGTWVTGNALLWHTVLANANPLDFDYFSAMISAFAQFNALPLVAAAALFGLPVRSAERLWRAYFVVSGLVALATIGKLGASSNYWLEFTAATCVLIGVLAVRLATSTDARAGFTCAGLAGLVLASLLTCIPAYQLTLKQTVAIDLTGPSADSVRRMDAAALIANEPGPVLTDDPGVALLAGKRVEFEFIIYTILAVQGVWDETPILEAIRAHQFGLVVMIESLDEPAKPLIASRFTENVRAALQAEYTPAGHVDGYWLYRPDG